MLSNDLSIVKTKSMKRSIFLFLLLFGATSLSLAQWEADVRLTNDSAISYPPFSWSRGLAVSGDSVHVVWYDKRDGNFEIYYKHSTNGGVSWSSDTRLTSNDSVSGHPALAISGSNVYVVWRDNRDGNTEIYYKHSTDGGLGWGADVRLTNDDGNSFRPSISVSGSDVHVVWQDNRDGNDEIYYKNSTDGGLNWGNDYNISNDAARSQIASISASGSNVHVVWEDRRDGGAGSEIYYKRSTDGGQSWGTDMRLTNNTYISNVPASAISGSNVYVVWCDSRDLDWEIYCKRSQDKGLTWGPDTRLTNASGYSNMPTLAVSGKGVHIAWQDNRNANEEIFYKYSNDGGLSWSDDTLLVNNSSTMSIYPSIALSGSMVHVIWSDKRDGPNGEIYYKRNPTGSDKTSGVEGLDRVKSDVSLYPNPFSKYTRIEFKSSGNENFEVQIFNQSGIQIQTLLYANCLPGINALKWDGLDSDNKPVPNGIYHGKIVMGKQSIVKKMIVLK